MAACRKCGGTFRMTVVGLARIPSWGNGIGRTHRMHTSILSRALTLLGFSPILLIRFFCHKVHIHCQCWNKIKAGLNCDQRTDEIEAWTWGTECYRARLGWCEPQDWFLLCPVYPWSRFWLHQCRPAPVGSQRCSEKHCVSFQDISVHVYVSDIYICMYMSQCLICVNKTLRCFPAQCRWVHS